MYNFTKLKANNNEDMKAVKCFSYPLFYDLSRSLCRNYPMRNGTENDVKMQSRKPDTKP